MKSSSALENLQYSSLLNMRQEGLLFVVQWFQSTEFFLCKTGCGTCGQDRQMVSQLCVHLTHIMLRTRKLLRSVIQSRDLHLPLSAGEECCFFITASRLPLCTFTQFRRVYTYMSNWFGFAIALFSNTSLCLRFKSLFIYFFKPRCSSYIKPIYAFT